MIRKIILALTGLVIFYMANSGIRGAERLLDTGDEVYLQLAPVDPRSIMQGDYMRLRFALEDDIGRTVNVRRGVMILELDENKIGRFSRRADGASLQDHEVRLKYRSGPSGIKLSTDAYFFQEGTAEIYEQAEYGVFRVAPDGTALLSHLADENLTRIGPEP